MSSAAPAVTLARSSRAPFARSVAPRASWLHSRSGKDPSGLVSPVSILPGFEATDHRATALLLMQALNRCFLPSEEGRGDVRIDEFIAETGGRSIQHPYLCGKHFFSVVIFAEDAG